MKVGPTVSAAELGRHAAFLAYREHGKKGFERVPQGPNRTRR